VGKMDDTDLLVGLVGLIQAFLSKSEHLNNCIYAWGLLVLCGFGLIQVSIFMEWLFNLLAIGEVVVCDSCL
jgi:hypothetical protein